MRAALALAAMFTLSACAGMEPPVEAKHDPNHRQQLTGSRIPYKGKGGPDQPVRYTSQQDAKDHMGVRMNPKPDSN